MSCTFDDMADLFDDLAAANDDYATTLERVVCSSRQFNIANSLRLEADEFRRQAEKLRQRALN